MYHIIIMAALAGAATYAGARALFTASIEARKRENGQTVRDRAQSLANEASERTKRLGDVIPSMKPVQKGPKEIMELEAALIQRATILRERLRLLMVRLVVVEDEVALKEEEELFKELEADWEDLAQGILDAKKLRREVSA